MIKTNKKNKFLTFLCACLVTCATALGFVGSIGTTLASSPSEPTINTTYFDYTSSSFLSKYDTFFYNYPPSNLNNSSTQIGLTFMEPISGMSSTSMLGANVQTFKIYCNYANIGFTDVLTNSLSSIKVCNYTSTSSSIPSTYGLVLVFSSASEIYNNYARCRDLIICFSYKDIYYVVGDYGLYSNYLAYTTGFDVGFNDVDTSGVYNDGYSAGYSAGQTNGYNTGYAEGQTNGITQGQNNVLNNPNDFGLNTNQQLQDSYNQGNSDGYTEGYGEGHLDGYDEGYAEGQSFGYDQGINQVVNNPNNYGLYTSYQYETNYNTGYQLGLSQGYETGYNTGYNEGDNQGYTNGYNQGFIDGEHSSDAYQNGYNTGLADGVNQVLNNPNQYNLYTEEQYQQNYIDGYNQGLATARYGSFGSYDGSLTITSNTSLDGVPTYQQTYNKEQSFMYKGSAVIINSTLLTILNDYSEDYRINIDITFNNPFTYSDKTAFNFVNNYLLSRYLTLDYTLYDVDNNVYVCSYIVTPVYDSENNLVDYNVVNDVPISVYGKEINKLIILTINNVNDLSKIALSQNSLEYENGYNVGYETGYNNGTNSDIVNNAYNDGYTTGNRVGYQQGLSNGLANSNDYTFFGLIGAVIDAPIQYISSLFNFNILGFNMLAFLTSLFTVCIVIWIIKMLMGGK